MIRTAKIKKFALILESENGKIKPTGLIGVSGKQ